MDQVAQSPVTIETADGHRLAGNLWRGPSPRAAVLISSGTGFPWQFYSRMAAHLAARGAVVLAFDYRGIAASAPETLKGSEIELTDWSRYDQPAALDALAAAAPGLPITHIAHSVGGHFLGLWPNHAKVARHAFVSIGSGYWGHHQPRNLPMEMMFWWGIGAISLLRHGYVASGKLWRGTDLPPRVFRTWRKWAHRRAYLGSDMGALAPEHYAEVRTPIRSWIFTDDPIATPRAADVILDLYPNAPREVALHAPADFNLQHIGHDGAFRKGREALWDDIWSWLTAAP